MLLLIFFTIVVLYFFIEFIYRKSDATKTNFEEIPGPKGLPLVGNIEELFLEGDEIWRRKRARADKYYPIYKMKVLNQRIVHILDPVDAEVILDDPKITKGDLYEPMRYWLGNGLLLSEGEHWKRARKLLTKSFHFETLTNYMTSFNEEVKYLLKSLKREENETLDLSHFFNVHTFKIIMEILCGEKVDMRQEKSKSFLKALETMDTISSRRMMVPLMNVLYKFTHWKKKEDEALKIFNDFSTHVIQKNNDSKDNKESVKSKMMDILLKNFDDKGVQYEINTFLFAGQDTTSTALNFILYILGNKAYHQDELLKEITEVTGTENATYGEISQMNLLDRFIKECFRICPVATLVGRTLNKDITIPSGYTIPAGTTVIIDIFDIHRNPKCYPNPEVFDPDRFLPENIRKRHPFSFIPFSAGPRNCIAQRFAMLEIKTALCGILRKYRIKAAGSLEDMVFVPDMLLKTKYPLQVRLIPRSYRWFLY